MLGFLERGRVVKESMFEMINLIFDLCYLSVFLQLHHVMSFPVPCWLNSGGNMLESQPGYQLFSHFVQDFQESTYKKS